MHCIDSFSGLIRTNISIIHIVNVAGSPRPLNLSAEQILEFVQFYP